MSFIWTKKIKQATQPQVVIEVVQQQQLQLPVYEPVSVEDKISVTEHKNGKCLVSSREEDNAFGSREEEVDGQEVVLPCVEDSKVELQEE